MRTATPIHTPIGPMLLVAEDDRPVRLTDDLDQPLSPPGPQTARLISDLQAQLAGKLPRALSDAQIAELLTGRVSDFQLRVLRAINDIQPGQVRTYGQLGEQIGQPGASRAVGSACASNPLPLAIACHRVIAADGMGRYSGPGGEAAKRLLLTSEGVDVEAL
jgi:methylated-DNA-[protein]-cysteine S-methyltransferase